MNKRSIFRKLTQQKNHFIANRLFFYNHWMAYTSKTRSYTGDSNRLFLDKGKWR
jgi:hypothetical protein